MRWLSYFTHHQMMKHRTSQPQHQWKIDISNPEGKSPWTLLDECEWLMQNTGQQNTSSQRRCSNGKLCWPGDLMPRTPRHAQNLNNHLPYLRRFQHSQGVGHSGEGLICLLDIDGEFVKSIRGRGTRLHRGGQGSREARIEGRANRGQEQGWNRQWETEQQMQRTAG